MHGIAFGASQGLGLQSLLADLGWKVKLRLHSDATAVIGMCKRKGLGKVRHLATADLWIQEKIKSREIDIQKMLGSENPADALTKYIDRATMMKIMKQLNMVPMSGRPQCAPAAMGVNVQWPDLSQKLDLSRSKMVHVGKCHCQEVQCH